MASIQVVTLALFFLLLIYGQSLFMQVYVSLFCLTKIIFKGPFPGVGLSIHPMYLTECAPKRLRGMVGVTVATFMSLGKFCGQLLGIR